MKGSRPGSAHNPRGRGVAFGMNAHVSTDRRGIVQGLVTTPANEADINQLPQLLTGQQEELMGEQLCWSELHRHCTK